MQELDIIRSFVARVRRHLVRRRLTEALVLGAVALLGWLLGAAVLGPWLPDALATTIVLWGVLMAALAVVGWRVLGRALLQARSERGLAREIERSEPALRNDLVTALQFGERPASAADAGASEAMVRAHLRETARTTERYRNRLEALFSRRDLRQSGRVAALLAIVLVLVAVSFPGALSSASMHLLGVDATDVLPGVSVDERDGQVARRLLVRDLEVELRYPAYTNLRKRRMRNTSGNLETLRGTEVHFEGRLVQPARSASVVLEAEDGTQTERVAEIRGDRVVGSFAALQSGTWRFRLTTEDGAVVDNDIERTLVVQPDLEPVISIEEPRGIVEVTAREAVTLRINAADDFGLSEVALRVSFEGVEDSVERRHIANVNRQASWAGEATIDLRELDLQPKDVIVVHAEAVDNDEVSSPKSALSAPLMLRVASPEDRHEAVLRQEQALLDALIGLLADYLETPLLSDEPGQVDDDGGRPGKPVSDDASALMLAAQQLSQRRYQVLASMLEVVERMESDELMLTRDLELVRSLYATLYDKHRNAERALERMAMLSRADQLAPTSVVMFARDHRIPQVETTERTILLLEELIASQWLDAAQMTVNQIREIRERLETLLREYQETGDPQLKAEILKEIGRLQKRIDELLGRLSQQMQQVPPEHMNVDAGQGEPSDAQQSMQNLAQSAQQIRDMLEAGDIEGALKALEQLDEGLQGMLSITNQATGGGGGNGLSQLDQQASELMDALNDLSAAEAALEQETGELREQMRQRNAEAMKERLEPFLDAQKQRMDAIREELDALAQQPLNERDREAVSEMERALDSAERLLELEDVEGLQPLVERLSERADDARRRFMTSRASLSPKDPARDDYQPSLDGAQRIGDGANEMLRDIDDLLFDARPEPDPAELERMQQLAEQQKQIRQRAEALEHQIAQSAEEFPQLEQLAPEIGKATDFMDDASGSLERGDVPRGLENERQAMRSLRSMKQQLQQTVERQRQRDQQGRDQKGERVEIPQADRDPRLFHQEIMDAMKAPGLGGYEEENNLYYESLVE